MPVVAGLPFGHVPLNATLALGIVFKGAGSFSLDAMIFRRGAGKDGGGKSDGK